MGRAAMWAANLRAHSWRAEQAVRGALPDLGIERPGVRCVRIVVGDGLLCSHGIMSAIAVTVSCYRWARSEPGCVRAK